MSFDGISPKNGNLNISNQKYSKQAKHCVTLKDMFDNNFKETDITDVICESCSNLNGKSTETNFDKSQNIKNHLLY